MVLTRIANFCKEGLSIAWLFVYMSVWPVHALFYSTVPALPLINRLYVLLLGTATKVHPSLIHVVVKFISYWISLVYSVVNFSHTCVERPRKFVSDGSVKGYWFGNEDIANSKVILYIHGGGYVFGDPLQYCANYYNLVEQLEQNNNRSAAIFALQYELAPTSCFPKPIEQAVQAYKWLLKQGISPLNITIAGDSAGGNATLGCVCRLKQLRCPLPKTIVLISPMVDMRLLSESWKTNQPTDVLSHNVVKRWVNMYLNGNTATAPMASPTLMSLEGFPPTMIIAGETEVMFDDIKAFSIKMQQSKVHVVESFHALMFHDFCFAPLTGKKTRAVWKDVVSFITSQ